MFNFLIFLSKRIFTLKQVLTPLAIFFLSLYLIKKSSADTLFIPISKTNLLQALIPTINVLGSPKLIFTGVFSETDSYTRIFNLYNARNKSSKQFFYTIYKLLWSSDYFLGFGKYRTIRIFAHDDRDRKIEILKNPLKIDSFTTFKEFYQYAERELLIPYGSFDTSYLTIYVTAQKNGRHKNSTIPIKQIFIVLLVLFIYFNSISYDFHRDFDSNIVFSSGFWSYLIPKSFRKKVCKVHLVEDVVNRSGTKSIKRFYVEIPQCESQFESAAYIHKSLWEYDEFLKHGSKKIMFVTAYSVLMDQYVTFHPNILVTNDTIFDEYLEKIRPYLKVQEYRYKDNEIYTKFMVTVVDATPFQDSEINVVKVKNEYGGYDSTRINVKKGGRSLVKPNSVRSFSTSCCNNHLSSITKIRRVPVNLKDIATVDIETIILDPVSRVHVPIAISTVSKDFRKLFIVDRNLLEVDPNKAVTQMFNEYLDFMQSLNKSYVIFAHNLGGYDGLLLYKHFLQIPDKIYNFKTLIDADHRFISIDYRYLYMNGRMKKPKNITLTWKDSLRLFPGSLESLCKQFNVVGKISKYDMAFNNISLFDNPELFERFKEYSLQDSIALYNALITAQRLYFDNYKVDICETYSTASLAFKIYRTNFMQHEIPLLNNSEEAYIRKAYFGGATDYYKAVGEGLYWYDVNSLYPFAMMGELPYKVIKKHKDLSGVNISDFKGFVKAKITSPDNIKHPLIPYRTDDRIIYPTGSWTGIYFSDLLAKAQTYGYKIELIEGIEFEYIDLFSEYIKHFYEVKKTSTGSLRYLAKLKLNSLYGMFGRKKDTLTAENVLNEDLDNYLLKNNVTNIIKINDKVSTVISEDITNKSILRELNAVLTGHDIGGSDDSRTLANVAIAAAITARAQMVMMDYKNNPDFDLYYTDTDSIFTDKPLPDHLVGSELGQMKNEVLDKWGVDKIDKACFVGIKKYGLSVTDSKGNIHENSVFSGVPRNTLSYDEVLKIQNGTVIERKIENRFVKTFINLEISNQKPFILHISNKRYKTLENNTYIPINANTINNKFRSIIDKFVRRISYLMKKHL